VVLKVLLVQLTLALGLQNSFLDASQGGLMARGLAWLRGSVRVAPAVRFFLLLSKELLAQLVVLPLPQVIRVGAKLALHLGVGVVGRRGSTSRRRPALSRGSTMSLTTRGSLLSLQSHEVGRQLAVVCHA